MNSFWQDLRYGVRTLMKHPGFTLVATITLALGIGANTAIFSVVSAVLLRALPFQNPERLVSVGRSASGGGLPGLAAYEYLAWKANNKAFVDLAAYSSDNFNFIGHGGPERISCAQVTASLFTTLGVQPLRGRVFLPEEDLPGQNQVVVVSEAFWQRRYGKDAALLSRSLILNDKSYAVVGVMPSSFRFPGNYEIWMPLALDAQKEAQGDTFTLVDVVGRLKPEVTTETAQTELNFISRQASDQARERLPFSTLEVVSLHQHLVAGIRRTVLVLWGAVALVMLLACANVATLVLSRTVSRNREIAVRAAVGARRWQLIRQLLTESVFLGLIGGLLGMLIAVWCTRGIASFVPDEFANAVSDLNSISMDWRVFGFILTLSLATGVMFGLAPALTASRPDLVSELRGSGGNSRVSFGLRSMRGWLVVGELGLAMILLLAAGLLVRSFSQLNRVDPGFDRENVLTARIDLPRSTYASPARAAAFQQQLITRVSALPGVQSVGTINHKPLAGFGMVAFISIEGQPAFDRKKDRPIGIGVVSSDYFRTMKIPLISGRGYDDRDGPESSKVALVNQAFARRYFPDDPLGKRISFGCKDGLCRTIVGVVGNVRQESLTEEVIPEIYVPFAQMPTNGMTLLVRTNSDPLSLARTVRNEVLAIDRNQPLYDVKTLEQRVAETLSVSRALMLLFGGFALLALVLATVGIYGIVSYSVSQRTREIGIRMALGAGAADVLQLIMKNGITTTLIGISVGLAGALVLTRFLSSLLFGVTPTDGITFVAVSGMLVLVAMAACLIPARRATRIDPLVALRNE